MTEAPAWPVQRPWRLDFQALGKRYGSEVLFAELSFSAQPGQAIRVVGPNGSGKTQLLLSVSGFVSLDSGSIVLKQEAVRKSLRGSPWRRDSLLRFVPSMPGAVSELPISQAAYAFSRHLSPFSMKSAARSAARFFARWQDELEEAVGETVASDRLMGALSVGQQKRLMLASTLLAPRPPLALLLDEPLAGLDRKGIELAVGLLERVRSNNVALLVAEHRAEVDDIRFDQEISLPHRLRPFSTTRRPDSLAGSPVLLTEPEEKPNTVLEIRNAVVGYPGSAVSCELLRVTAGGLVLVEGSNGSGKTGFLKGILGESPARLDGSINFKDTRVPSLRLALVDGRARSMDQLRHSFDDLRVEDAVAVAAPPGSPRLPALQDPLRALGPRKRVSSLSSGNRALLTLCQTLAPRPDLAILDEPFANVDAMNRERMLRLINRARNESGTAFLIVEHTGEALQATRRYTIEHNGSGPALLTACREVFSPTPATLGHT